MRYILSLGGKRLRPVAVLLVADAFNHLDDNALNAALAIEYFHNFSLVHDDIMDASNLRRGLPTVHKKYDSNTAILSGDGLLIKAYESLNKIDQNKTEVFGLFNKTSLEVCEGQQMDMNFEGRDDVTLDEYITMIKLKTAVLIGCAFQLGGLVSNISLKDQERLYQIGLNLGIAFQIMDDYLDAYSTQTGKRIGGDIVQNKKTALYLTAMNKAPEEDQTKLRHWYTVAEFDEDVKVQSVLEIFKSCNVDKAVLNIAQIYHQEAQRNFDELNIPESGRSNIEEFFDVLKNRNS